MPRYVVITASTPMPASVSAPYRKVAVMETDGEHIPRHRAVKRIVWAQDRLFAGKTNRCAYRRALAEAHRLAYELNETSN